MIIGQINAFTDEQDRIVCQPSHLQFLWDSFITFHDCLSWNISNFGLSISLVSIFLREKKGDES